MRSWDVGDPSMTLLCPLCNTTPDSHEHLFFRCNYSSHVWNSVKVLTSKSNIPNELDLIVDSMITMDAAKSFSTTASKLLFAASCYFIWQERNSRLFKKTKRTHDQLVKWYFSIGAIVRVLIL
nr:hypothetical protein [Tanacetum cinerariifolium]